MFADCLIVLAQLFLSNHLTVRLSDCPIVLVFYGVFRRMPLGELVVIPAATVARHAERCVVSRARRSSHMLPISANGCYRAVPSGHFVAYSFPFSLFPLRAPLESRNSVRPGLVCQVCQPNCLLRPPQRCSALWRTTPCGRHVEPAGPQRCLLVSSSTGYSSFCTSFCGNSSALGTWILYLRPLGFDAGGIIPDATGWTPHAFAFLGQGQASTRWSRD